MSALAFRKARADDIAAIVALLADDELGARRENTSLPLARCYMDAFAAIEANPAQRLIVVEQDGDIVGTFQMSFLPGIALQGLLRGQIEAVRVAAGRRSAGIGAAMIRWAVEQCREAGCGVVQLTTNKMRHDAHRFYDRLGFKQSHFGYKLTLFENET